MTFETIGVVGASLSGLRSCEALRTAGFAGTIVLVGEENHTPYDRPPLSKQFLAGSFDENRIALRPPEKIEALGLDLRLGVKAKSLNIEQKLVQCSDGPLAYDGLVIATGAHPRTLPGTEAMDRVITIRTLDDAKRLRSLITGVGCRLVVIGGGFLGMEVAATANGLGAVVTVIEPLQTPLERVLGPIIGRALQAEHESHGVTVRAGIGINAVIEHEATVSVELSDASTIEADVMVVAIGVIPTTEWLEGSGLTLDNGVVCDESLRAGPDIVAAGDIARWPIASADGLIRLEHWTNATEQSAHAVATLLGTRETDTHFGPVQYFWSDHFDLKIQAIGLPSADDEVHIVEGSLESRRFVALYSKNEQLKAVLGFGRPRQVMGFRPLLVRGASIEDALAHPLR